LTLLFIHANINFVSGIRIPVPSTFCGFSPRDMSRPELHASRAASNVGSPAAACIAHSHFPIPFHSTSLNIIPPPRILQDGAGNSGPLCLLNPHSRRKLQATIAWISAALFLLTVDCIKNKFILHKEDLCR
jgi:hypothetical protein